MKRVAFLLDEHIPESVADACRGIEPLMMVLHLGHEPATPVSGTLDPDVLIFAEENALAVVTFDKRTMGVHTADHLTAGRRTWGLFIFPDGNYLSPGQIAEELNTLWGASDADEWIDQVKFLPF